MPGNAVCVPVVGGVRHGLREPLLVRSAGSLRPRVWTRHGKRRFAISCQAKDPGEPDEGLKLVKQQETSDGAILYVFGTEAEAAAAAAAAAGSDPGTAASSGQSTDSGKSEGGSDQTPNVDKEEDSRSSASRDAGNAVKDNSFTLNKQEEMSS